MKKKSTIIKASEFLQQLEENPEYQRQIKEKQASLKSIHDEWDRAEMPLIQSLRDSGYEVDSVWDLLEWVEPYSDLIPLLLKEYHLDYPERIKEGVVRALTVPEAAGIASKPLIEAFKAQPTTSPPGLKWVIGNAIMVTMTLDNVDEVIQLATDPAHGEARNMLPFGLARFRRLRPDVEDVLQQLFDDPQIGKDARKAYNRESPIERN